MDTNQKNIIDDYLAGRLDSNAVSDFERKLANNTELKSELEFQKQVVEGIKSYRKAQLKSQLSNVTISPYGGIVYSTVGKIAAGVAVSVLVGGAAYMLVTDAELEESIVSEKQIVINAPERENQSVRDFNWHLEVEDNTGEEVIVREETAENDEVIDPSKIIADKDLSSNMVFDNSNSGVDEVVEESQKNVFTPSIVLPDDVSDIESEEGIVIEPISKDLFEKPKASGEDQVEIEIDAKKSTVFAYKYFDSKLTLMGEFNEGPYQILEVIGQGEKDIYLFYADNYYEIALTSEPKPLQKITSEQKIKELEILKNYK